MQRPPNRKTPRTPRVNHHTAVSGDTILIDSLETIKRIDHLIIDRILEGLKGKRSSSREELQKAFAYAIKQTEQRRPSDQSKQADLALFLSTLSDVLNVQEHEISQFLRENNIELPIMTSSPLTKAMDWKTEEGEEFEESEDGTLVQDKGKQKVDSEGEKIDSPTQTSPSARLLLAKSCKVYSNKTQYMFAYNAQRLLTKKTGNYVWLQADKSQLEALTKYSVAALSDMLMGSLTDYNVSSEIFKHPVFGTWCVSCYPQEKESKVSMLERFSEKYKHPEKEAKYARPILDIELIPMVGPCVRCYLTLAARPRPQREDKDVTQNPNGTIIFSNVNLMNFGDPLRAFTWVEDYLKHRDEHGEIGLDQPIIRSFLIPVKEYLRTTSDDIMVVDADRAPGQVRIQVKDYQLNAVKNSLVSFMDGSVDEKDGRVIPLAELGHFLVGERVHPLQLTSPDHVAHQHGRMMAGESERYESVDVSTKAGRLLDARLLERDLAGFNLEPNSSLSSTFSFYKKNKQGEPKKKKSGEEQKNVSPEKKKGHQGK